jgi:hypothetical protein
LDRAAYSSSAVRSRRDYFYLLDWSDSVIDIREQFPLEREKTLTIADSKKIKHPEDSETKTLLVFTANFFITIRKNAIIEYLARTIKPSQLLNDPRIIDKLLIFFTNSIGSCVRLFVENARISGIYPCIVISAKSLKSSVISAFFYV